MQHRMKILASMIIAAGVAVACGPKPAATTDSAGAATAAAPADRSADEAAIKALDQQYFSAVKAKDVNMLADTYSNDAVSMPPNNPPLMGHDDIVKYNDAMLKTPNFGMTGETKTVSFSDDGTVAYAWGTYSATWTDAKGKAVKDEGKYLNVLRKVDGKWKVVMDSFSSNSPAQM
jgi:uncharacterized protein (TIGR02246 family)